MPDEPRDPFTVAQTILQAVVDGFAAADVTLPERQEIIAGVLGAWDSDQLTVALPSIYPGLIGAQQSQPVPWQISVLTGVFTVQLVRKRRATLANAPRRSLPTAAQVTYDGQMYMTDARLVAAAMQTAVRTNAIGEKGAVKFQGVLALEPQGDLLGLQASVEVILA